MNRKWPETFPWAIRNRTLSAQQIEKPRGAGQSLAAREYQAHCNARTQRKTEKYHTGNHDHNRDPLSN